MKFIKFHGDSIQYNKWTLLEYEQNDGTYLNNEKNKESISHVIQFPFNKGYEEETLIKTLYPQAKYSFDAYTKSWLIYKYKV